MNATGLAVLEWAHRLIVAPARFLDRLSDDADEIWEPFLVEISDPSSSPPEPASWRRV